MNVTFRKEALAAVAHFAGKQDMRYYLNGVMVEIGKNESRLVATNGHAMGAYRVMSGHGETIAPRQFIIPASVVTMFKPKRNDPYAELTLKTFGEDKGELSDGSGLSMSFRFIEGKFPDYRRVFPETVNGKPAQISIDLLNLFLKAAKALGADPRSLLLAHNEHGIMVTLSGEPHFAGVVMGLHSEGDVPTKSPRWVRETLQTA